MLMKLIDSRKSAINPITTLSKVLKRDFWDNVSMVTAAVMGAATIAGAAMQSSAAEGAAQTQASAAESAQQLQYQEFQQQQGNIQPWLQAGQSALQTLQAGIQPGGQFNKPFTLADFQSAPGYQFQKQQGEQAITAGAAARGMNLSPATLKSLDMYNTGLANQDYQQAYQNYLTNQNIGYSETANMAKMGYGATQMANQTAQTYANNAGSLQMQGANALAAGQVAGGNVMGSAISNLGNQYMMYQMLNNSGTTTPSFSGLSGDVSAGLSNAGFGSSYSPPPITMSNIGAST